MKTKRKHLIVLLLSIMAVAILGAGIHHHLQTSAQNKTFKDTQSWLQGVMNSIAARNPGSKRVSDPYCRRPSAKYEQTERVCSVGEYIIYPAEITSIENKVTEINSQFIIASSLPTSLKQGGFGEQIKVYGFTKNGLDCFISYYSLNNENGMSYSSKITEKYTGLLISASCSGPAMADYFPNKD